MTIVVEDGSRGNAAANSYVSLADTRAFALSRGITLDADDAVLEPIVIKAMDFLESHADRFIGLQVDRDQPLQWPRTDVVIESYYWLSTEIPRQVINALNNLVLEVNAGDDPFNPPANDDLPVVGESVEGAVSVQYANPGQALKVSKEQKSEAHIALLLENNGLFLTRA